MIVRYCIGTQFCFVTVEKESGRTLCASMKGTFRLTLAKKQSPSPVVGTLVLASLATSGEGAMGS